VQAAPGPTPRELAARLRGHADRIGGAQALALRGRDVPHAHRVFFRHVGLDPDEWRGFAFGCGIERAAQLRHSISEIRPFWENDLRALRQF